MASQMTGNSTGQRQFVKIKFVFEDLEKYVSMDVNA
jgi:hypothetical protein